MMPTLNKIDDDAGRKRQTDLFGDAATVHSVATAAGGPRNAVDAAHLVALNPQAASLPRALSGRGGRLIADTAAAAMMREIDGGGERGYSYSAWCLAGLPHREHPKAENWLIETDFARLLVPPGVRLRDDNSQENIGVPHGSFARLLLVDLQSEAPRTGSREIAMERSASALVARIGVGRGGPTNFKVADQLERLSTCSIDFAFGADKKGVVVNQRLVDAFEYVAEPDRRTRDSMRVIERLMLSQAFFDERRSHSVLFDRAAPRDLAASPLAIDVYPWLAHRPRTPRKETPVGWDRTWRQFGGRVGEFQVAVRGAAASRLVGLFRGQGARERARAFAGVAAAAGQSLNFWPGWEGSHRLTGRRGRGWQGSRARAASLRQGPAQVGRAITTM